ncbi:MAG: choice-of-anchor J domain-containing protein [Clostridia bacterium]|nr:choice-of-anchor J domain-containing protein [Clostridia bacterium]
MTKKLIAIVVAAMMLLSLIPASALAANAERAAAPAVKEQTQVALWDLEVDPLENGWEFRDEDGDNNNWQWVNETYADVPIATSGEYSIRSRSYFGTALTPDNWAVSPAVELPEAETIVLSVMAASYMGSYPETFALYAFVDGAEEPVALGDDMQSPATSREFAEFTADLSEYAGQSVQVAVRHYNCVDQYMFYVDDIAIVADPEENPPVDPTEPPVDPTEPPVDPTEPPVDPTEPPAESSLIAGYYFESEDELADWTLIGTADTNWVHSDNNPSGYDYTPYAHEGSGFIMSYSFVDYVGAYQADNWAITPAVELPEGAASLSFYSTQANPDYPESFDVYIGTSAETAEMTLLQSNISPSTGAEDNWTHYEFDLSDYAGQTVYVAFYDHCYDMYEIWLDQVEFFGEGGDQPPVDPTEPPTDPQVIDAIAIEGFVEPAWGENPFFGVTVPNDANYTLESAIWNWWSEEDFGELTETDTFDHEDYEYTMLFVVTPNEGYEFAENAVVTINGEQTLADGNFIYIETDSATFYTIGFYVTEPAPMPSLDEALNVEGGELHFESEGAYPWFVVEEGDRIYAQSGNAGVSSSDSILTTTITANAGDVVKFEYRAFGEGTSTYWDYCEFSIDGQRVGYWGAQQNDWELFTSEPMTAGEHTLTWKYHKDSSVNPNGDFFAVDNVEIAEGELPATGVLGDVDMDGDVDTADALMALRYVMGLIELNEDQLAQAEVTGDGNVTVADPLLILRHALGLVESFPAEEA